MAIICNIIHEFSHAEHDIHIDGMHNNTYFHMHVHNHCFRLFLVAFGEGLPHLHSVDRGDAGSRPSSVQDISAVSASSSGHGHADEAKATTASGPKGHSEQSQMTLESVGTLAMQVWSMLIAKRRKVSQAVSNLSLLIVLLKEIG